MYLFIEITVDMHLKTIVAARGHLLTDLRTLNVKMTIRGGGGGYSCDVNVQKCKTTFFGENCDIQLKQ